MELNVLGEFIIHAKGLIPADLCQSIVALFDESPDRRAGYTVNSQGERVYDSVKKSTDLEFNPEGSHRPLHERLHLEVSKAVMRVVAEAPGLQTWPVSWSGYKIQHYKKGEGEFHWHFDALGPGAWSRQLAMVLYLNTVQEGGETCFLHQGVEVKPVEGDAVFFPTFWTHYHRGAIPLSNDKYVISSFVSFSIPKSGDPK